MNDELNQALRKIIDFIEKIGLAVVRRDLADDTILPGITVEAGDILFDTSKLKYPGDLLHEAGHLAILSAQQRKNAGDDFAGSGGYEMAAIAWSYAACVHLELPLEILFHGDGYKGDASWLIDTFYNGTYIGLPILEWKGMACAEGEGAFPEMKNWLCS